MSKWNNHNHSYEESYLIRGIQMGEEKAFEAVYRLYYPKMCDLAQYLIHEPEVVEELVQDVFMKIWENRRQWHPKGSIRSYLYCSIKNRSFDYLKHQKIEHNWLKLNWGLDADHPESPHEHLVQTELEQQIEKWVQQLPDKRKIVFLLSRTHGLSNKEIAEVLDISVNTVETQMGRALKQLRECLVKYLHNYS